MLTLNQLRQLQRETFVAAIEYHEQLASTNDRAIELANDPAQKRPTLIVARDQTAGRGRGSNQWWSRAGALTFSLLLNGAEIGDQRRSWPLVSLSMGVAICDAIKAHCPDLKVGLKWPNDVYISGRRVNAPYLERNGASHRCRDVTFSREKSAASAEPLNTFAPQVGGLGRKVAGILIECPSQAATSLIVGIGINVNNSAQSAPKELQDKATSLVDLTWQRHEPLDFLKTVLDNIEDVLARLGDDRGWVQQRWKTLCVLSGQYVEIVAGGQTDSGVCRGIDEDGALVLETPAGIAKYIAGVVRSIGDPGPNSPRHRPRERRWGK